LRSKKGWTAWRCSLALGRQGQFWQHESFAYIIRNQAEWKKIMNYVVNNPVKASGCQAEGLEMKLLPEVALGKEFEEELR
jgi:hypothetical protein